MSNHFYHNLELRTEILTQRLEKDIAELVIRSLKEDLGGELDITNDVTSNLIPVKKFAIAKITTHNSGIFCGKRWVEEIFIQLGGDVKLNWFVEDGQKITMNQLLFEIHGKARLILTAERTILNFIQTLSGVSTTVNNYVKLLTGTNTKLLDTRKTLPGLRTALKYAVLCGGGNNHRLDLSNSFLIKENHIKATGSIKKAIHKAKEINPNIPIEVEVESIEEHLEALKWGADIIMLDNFSIEDIQHAVIQTKNRSLLEVSGNITLSIIMKIAQIGIDYISVGALTKNIKSLDLSMRLE